MPSPLAEPLAVPGTETSPAQRLTFSLPGFSSPAFSPPLRFKRLFLTIGETFVRIAIAFFALSLPWLAAKQLYILEMTVSARKVAGTPLIIATGFEQRFWQIQPHNPLFDDLKIAISERDEALVELMRITKKAKKKGKKTLERDHENEESIKGLRKERDNLMAEVAKGERYLQKLQKEKEDEVEVLEKEITKGESKLRNSRKKRKTKSKSSKRRSQRARGICENGRTKMRSQRARRICKNCRRKGGRSRSPQRGDHEAGKGLGGKRNGVGGKESGGRQEKPRGKRRPQDG